MLIGRLKVTLCILTNNEQQTILLTNTSGISSDGAVKFVGDIVHDILFFVCVCVSLSSKIIRKEKDV
jgi:hypothetical protein